MCGSRPLHITRQVSKQPQVCALSLSTQLLFQTLVSPLQSSPLTSPSSTLNSYFMEKPEAIGHEHLIPSTPHPPTAGTKAPPFGQGQSCKDVQGSHLVLALQGAGALCYPLPLLNPSPQLLLLQTQVQLASSYKLPQILPPLSFWAPGRFGGARRLFISTLPLPVTPHPSAIWPGAPLTHICWGSSDFHISTSGALCQSLSSLTSLRHQKPLNIFLPLLGALSFPRSPAGCSPSTGLLSVSSLDFLNSHITWPP